MFYLALLVLSLIAVFILLWPLLMRRSVSNVDAKQLSILLHKQKLAALEEEKFQSEISTQDYHHSRERIEKSLLLEVAAENSKHGHKKSNPQWLWILPIIFIAFVVLLYWRLGFERGLHDYLLTQENVAQTDAEIKKLGGVTQIIRRLQQQVESKPDSRGWYLLGRLYLKNQQLPLAVQAFANADQLQPDQPQILISYAEALYLSNNNSLNAKARALLEKVLASEPDQADALSLLAIDAYQKQNFSQAIVYWQRLLPQLDAQSPVAENVLQLIVAAEQKLQQKPASAAAKIQLHIQVTLQPGLQQQLTGNEVVFIYAQAVNGPTMPLAVLRRTVKELPLTVTLDETMAMLPNFTLANVNQIRIKARISKTGQPLPSAGDLEGSSGIIDPQHPPKLIAVTIDVEN